MTTKRIFVKPKYANAIIRDPQTFVKLPKDGAIVPASNYWLRRIIDQDIIVADQATANKKRKNK